MISQSDIIKILVQRGCTDESVMSTANSPDCSVTQLLKKLTEVERFDLALDISMKLGLDVTAICKTWAMRCLSGRNFTTAREKFRFCFKRLCPSGNRKSHLQTKLLADIIDELRKLDEKPIILVEKVELIKHGIFVNPTSTIAMSIARNSISSRKSLTGVADPNYQHQLNASEATGLRKPIHLKPTILAECRYYLKEYGNICDIIKFNVENHLWDELAKILSENVDATKIDQLFLAEVVPYVLSTGHLSHLIQAIQKQDNLIINNGLYIKSLYAFCGRNRRFHTLYYIQSTTEDYLAAANTQLRYFFLVKPIENYRELNQRLGSLKLALNDHRKYLEKVRRLPNNNHNHQDPNLHPLTRDGDTNNDVNLYTRHKLDGATEGGKKDDAHLTMKESLVEQKIYTIERQIDITANFALNEVSGLMMDIWQSGPNLSFNQTTTSAMVNEDLQDNSSVSINDSYDILMQATSAPMDSFSPVTLFDQSVLRKTYLVALVLIYYDLSCGSYFSQDGLRLANDLISVYCLNKLNVYKIAMRILLEEEGCDIIKNAGLLLDCIRNDIRSRGKILQSLSGSPRLQRQWQSEAQPVIISNANDDGGKQTSLPIVTTPSSMIQASGYATGSNDSPAEQAGRAICDDVLRDAIASCREPDYKMELAKLLSNEAKIELYIEIGKLSNAQMLACNLNRPDYVSSIIEKASELNQNHVKTVCQLWLAKHDTTTSRMKKQRPAQKQLQKIQSTPQTATTGTSPPTSSSSTPK